ncbi:receptor-like protein EIX2 [Silene latifolia]|uniref:receptor-like protein EIX2 n=1 Tax=Silene latifolia TaxID=37657 RepID=UPI003D78649D
MLTTCVITQFLFILLLDVHQGLAVGCHEAEREALLMFKHSFSHPSNRLSSWKGKGCCDWEGVGCDNVTAFVNRLDLPNQYYDDPDALTASKLNPSLLELSQLRYLDLSGNDFQGSQIPKFIGSFKYLRYLNLSYSNFSGIVPSQLGSLTRLRTLSLSSLFLYNSTPLSSDLHWVSKLVSLQYLDFGGSHIIHANNSMHPLNIPPSLLVLHLDLCDNLDNSLLLRLFSNSTWLSRVQQLDLSGNSLRGTLPYVLANMTSLTYLDLSSNQLNGSIPLWLGNMTSLTYLDISDNELNGSIPLWLGHMTSLTYLDLSENELNVSIPLSMRSMRKLEHLDLSSNSFRLVRREVTMGTLGEVRSYKPTTIYSSLCASYDVENLGFGQNMIEGILPFWLGEFKYLRVLDLSYNRLNGPIPISIGRLSYLEYLDLSFNNLNGTIPHGLGQCKALVHIDLSSNFLHSALSEFYLDNLSRLEYLDLSFNVVEWNITSNWSPPFQLDCLRMVSCKIQSQFPQWIGEQTKLNILDFSANNISGELPKCFSSNQLTNINISHNQITGPVPYFSSPKLKFIDLSFNLLSGSLVHQDPFAKNDTVGTPVCQLRFLKFLDLQRNNISGGITDCWAGLEFLAYINLASNNLSGIIPLSMGLLSELAFLKLSNNSLQGPIPPTLSASSRLQMLDLGENKLDGNVPSNWGGKTFSFLELLRLRGNQLVGSIPPTLCSIYTLKFIDLSFNNLTGGIPLCLGHLLQMGSANVDGLAFFPFYEFPEVEDDSTMVVLKGAKLKYTSTLIYVVNLDLSCNALTGSIPEGIANLSALIGLNLSHNHLTGNIPNKIGEMTLLESLDLSNNNISRAIPPSISALTSLVRLNLSYNNLQGQIPTGHQLQVLEDPSMTYIGNPGLCGNPLPNKCETGYGENQKIQRQEKSDKVDVWEKPLLYFFIMSGFATGFWGVVGSLLLKKRFRLALFQHMGSVTDYFYVQVMIRLNRLRYKQ